MALEPELQIFFTFIGLTCPAVSHNWIRTGAPSTKTWTVKRKRKSLSNWCMPFSFISISLGLFSRWGFEDGKRYRYYPKCWSGNIWKYWANAVEDLLLKHTQLYTNNLNLHWSIASVWPPTSQQTIAGKVYIPSQSKHEPVFPGPAVSMFHTPIYVDVLNQ